MTATIRLAPASSSGQSRSTARKIRAAKLSHYHDYCSLVVALHWATRHARPAPQDDTRLWPGPESATNNARTRLEMTTPLDGTEVRRAQSDPGALKFNESRGWRASERASERGAVSSGQTRRSSGPGKWRCAIEIRRCHNSGTDSSTGRPGGQSTRLRERLTSSSRWQTQSSEQTAARPARLGSLGYLGQLGRLGDSYVSS